MVPLKALEYYYLYTKQELSHDSFKGLKRRSFFQFIEMMDKLEKSINEGRVLNYEEVLNNEYKGQTQDISN